LLVPGLTCIRGYFSGAFPFWVTGIALGILGYQRLLRTARWLLPLAWFLVLLGNTLLQFNLLDSRWTMPVADLLLISLGLPLGLHIQAVARRRESN